MSDNLKSVPGKKWVRRHYKDDSDDEFNEELIQVGLFESEPAKVNVSLGMTMNLGNYESLRVDVGVSLPCYREEIPHAQTVAYKIVEEELYKRIQEARRTIA